MSDLVPDVAGVFQAWRAFHVPLDKFSTPRLWSLSADYFWAAGEVAVAECETCGDECPKRSHSCGLYAAKSWAHLQTMEYYRHDIVRRPGHTRVVAVVALWGPYVEGTQGWRARYGYPQILFVPTTAWRVAKPLADEYGVPFRIVNTLEPVGEVNRGYR